MNRFSGIGRLTQDVKLNVTDKGVKYLRNSIAINDSYVDRETGARVENTVFVPFVIFGNAAETISKFQKKGNKILIEGAFSTSSYTDKDGNTRTSTEIRVSDFEFLDPKEKDAKATSTKK